MQRTVCSEAFPQPAAKSLLTQGVSADWRCGKLKQARRLLAALLALVLLAAGSGRVFPQFAARALDAPEFLEAAYQGDRANSGDRVNWICPGWKKDMSACPRSLIDG